MNKKTSKNVLALDKQIEHAVRDHKLLEEGDRILVAVSGGKDSLTMLDYLCHDQKKSKIKYEIIAVHVKTDFHCGACVSEEVLAQIFKNHHIRYEFKNIKVLDEKGKTGCFWCSWNRRKVLFQTAAELSCNKIAFGHHKDDIVETALLNLFYNGEISGMKARQELFKGLITIIRPLCFIEEDLIKHVAREKGIPEQLYQCRFGSMSKRKLMKDIIKNLEKNFVNTDFKSNVFKSLLLLKNRTTSKNQIK